MRIMSFLCQISICLSPPLCIRRDKGGGRQLPHNHYITDRSKLFEVRLDVGGGRRGRQSSDEHLLGPCHQLQTSRQQPPDDARKPHILLLFFLPSDLRPPRARSANPLCLPLKVYQMLGLMSGTKYSLRRFAHPSHKFYNIGEKCTIFAPTIFGHSRF